MLKKKLLSVVVASVMLAAMAFSVSAEQISLGVNSGGFTSTTYSSDPGTTYYAKVTSASYTNLPAGVYPSNGKFTFTLYTASGVVAGAQSTSVGVGTSVSPAINSYYQHRAGNYKLHVHNDSTTNGVTAVVSWAP